MSTSGARGDSTPSAATGLTEDEVRGTTVDELLDALNRGSDTLAERTAELREVQAQSLTPREHARMLTLLTSATGVDRLKRMLDSQTSERTGQGQAKGVGDGASRVDEVFEALLRKATSAEEAAILAESDLEARSFTGTDPESVALLEQLADLIRENARVGAVLQRENMSRLEAELAVHKGHHAELLRAREELQRFTVELEEELEGLQAVVMAEEACASKPSSSARR